jgi:hypothetical protein
MDELILDTRAIDALAKPRKRTWGSRQRRKIGYLANDIAALEQLVGKLLDHLERATAPGVTDEDRLQLRTMAGEIRGMLAEGKADD